MSDQTWIELDAAFLSSQREHRLVYAMPPHAPSLVTTISPNGTVNVGAFEQTMLCSNVPPLILLAISPKSDTLHNLRDGSECVIGFAYPHEVQKVYDAGVRLPRGSSELALIDFTTIETGLGGPPRLAECWLSAQGQMAWEQEAGDHSACGIAIERVFLDERLWHANHVSRRRGIVPLYYATNGWFFEPGQWTKVDESERVRAVDHAG